MFTLPNLPYAYNALEPHIDEQTMKIHHDKHHGTYVTNVNDLLKDQTDFLQMDPYELIKKLNMIPEAIRSKVRNNLGGHVNHTFFWQIMGPKKGGKPMGEVAKAVNENFGGFGQFQELFSKAAMGRFGSGWAWVVVESGRLTVIDTPNQDSPWMEGKSPILGLDVWEHAYYLKYQNRRVDYIKSWWNVVDWEAVDQLYIDAL